MAYRCQERDEPLWHIRPSLHVIPRRDLEMVACRVNTDGSARRLIQRLAIEFELFNDFSKSLLNHSLVQADASRRLFMKEASPCHLIFPRRPQNWLDDLVWSSWKSWSVARWMQRISQEPPRLPLNTLVAALQCSENRSLRFNHSCNLWKRWRLLSSHHLLCLLCALI